ncbi:MAG: hypothetical protein LBV54_07115 [Puniceicoccales bacterium]|jgi:hypothetical protein|nr:hypothetical protein [Puniceicoccales bacterium]
MNDTSQELPPPPEDPQALPMDTFPADGYPADALPDDMLPPPPPPPVTKWQQFWRRFGGDGFLVSMGIHAVLIIIALTWVVSRFVIAKEPSTFTTGAGGGNSGDKVSMLQNKIKPKHARNIAKNMPKLAAKGTRSSVAIPEMPTMNMSALDNSSSLAGSGSKGLGGGAGGGVGTGIGPGFGGKGMVSLFGAKGFNVPGLTGTFYDFKQTSGGQKQDPGVGGYKQLVNHFINTGWSEAGMGKFYKSPTKLSLQQVLIPYRQGNAGEAPAAFEAAGVEASRWMVHYKGTVSAPFTGKFRFAGTADDWITVRWQNQLVLDSGYDIMGTPTASKSKGKSAPPKVARSGDTFVMFPGRPPMQTSQWLDVRQGSSYQIEIAMGETPGGEFYAVLAYEKASEKGKLYLFRMSPDPLPEAATNGSKGQIPTNVDLGGGGIWLPKMATRNR